MFNNICNFINMLAVLKKNVNKKAALNAYYAYVQSTLTYEILFLNIFEV